MKKNNSQQYATALYEVTKDLHGAALSAMLKNFASLLTRRHLLKKSETIIADYARYSQKKEGIMKIKITSAQSLSVSTVEKIKAHFGKKTESEESVNHELMGGMVVETDDKILDASIKTQLIKLKEKMSK